MLISVFYHIWLPGRSNLELLLVKEQIQRLLSSGLADKSSVEVVFTGSLNDEALFYADDLSVYGFNVHTAAESSASLFEGYTLARIYDFALATPSARLLYFHTKGISYLSNPKVEVEKLNAVQSWRKYLEWGCIDLWKTQVEKLETHDVAGVNYSLWPWPHLSGNFWWARADYISRLPHPTESKYKKDFRDIGDEKRLKHEKWIGLGHPKVYSHFNAPMPYDNPFPASPSSILDANEPKWFWLYRDDISALIGEQIRQSEIKPKRKISLSIILVGDDTRALTQTLRALDKQTCYEWECILLVPGSAEVTPLQTELDERHTIVKSESLFQAEDINKVVRENCLGDIVVLVNAGNEPSPDYIAECLIELRMQPETALCFGFETMDRDAQAKGKIVYNRLQMFASNKVSTPVSFRKSDWEACGGFDGSMPETAMFWDMWVRLCEGERVAAQNPFCVAGNTGWNASDFENSIYLLRKHKSILNGLMPGELVLQTVNQEKLIVMQNFKLSNIDLNYTIPQLLSVISRKLTRRLKRIVK